MLKHEKRWKAMVIVAIVATVAIHPRISLHEPLEAPEQAEEAYEAQPSTSNLATTSDGTSDGAGVRAASTSAPEVLAEAPTVERRASGDEHAALPTPTVSAPIKIDVAQLTEEQMRIILRVTGWPSELVDSALKVSWCESRYSPGAIGGTSLGLFQIEPFWADYAHVYVQDLFDPVVNARVAYLIVQYDLDRGYPAWSQWTCARSLGGER